MRKPFQRIHASIVGKFEDGVGEKIPQWIRANGGQFSRDVNPRVTHLIATKEAFKSNAVPVQTAKKNSTIKIVSYDWLEDSLLSATRRPKPEGPYLLKNLMKPEKKEVKKNATPKSLKTVKEIKANVPKRRIVDPFLGSKGKRKPVRQVYQDKKTNVVYSITLFRPSKPPGNSREKYQLTLFESVAEPHTYSTYTKFSRVGTSNVELLAGPKCKLELAVDKFKQFFKEQTGKEWNERANGKMPPSKTDQEGNSLPAHEGWFYLEEKTTILGAFLREPQNPSSQGSTGNIVYDRTKEDNVDHMATHQVQDGDKGSSEADGNINESSIEDKMTNHQVEDGGEDGYEAGDDDDGEMDG
ncbi:uncharacterized protein PGRI_030050 [Penicillium griseofulvum]|uniref:Uncharacterized protein n=1 Tax=Penicillium patulum TaxID=5078 RepID=A0A135LJI7_PENPA|nr:uncharacterized protein PGRI_030050 [Penicillium griseofulvum]KXG49135.1 hypothetical protein PGRI_030050 [Penicillium griseofulvum]